MGQIALGKVFAKQRNATGKGSGINDCRKSQPMPESLRSLQEKGFLCAHYTASEVCGLLSEWGDLTAHFTIGSNER